jgi:hypothetical protein
LPAEERERAPGSQPRQNRTAADGERFYPRKYAKEYRGVGPAVRSKPGPGRIRGRFCPRRDAKEREGSLKPGAGKRRRIGGWAEDRTECGLEPRGGQRKCAAERRLRGGPGGQQFTTIPQRKGAGNIFLGSCRG